MLVCIQSAQLLPQLLDVPGLGKKNHVGLGSKGWVKIEVSIEAPLGSEAFVAALIHYGSVRTCFFVLYLAAGC